jgi:hypothetical protein
VAGGATVTATPKQFKANDRRRIIELETCVMRLAVALQRYGVHVGDCASYKRWDAKCTCGLISTIESGGKS